MHTEACIKQLIVTRRTHDHAEHRLRCIFAQLVGDRLGASQADFLSGECIELQRALGCVRGVAYRAKYVVDVANSGSLRSPLREAKL